MKCKEWIPDYGSLKGIILANRVDTDYFGASGSEMSLA